MELIGITGRARHGKDSIAKVLVDGFGFQRFAFADGVREMALAINPLVPLDGFVVTHARLSELVDLMSWDSAKQNPEVRRLLQVIGTEAVREIVGPDTWINIVRRKIAEHGDQVRAVITDVRFPNEAQAIELMGGEVWRVVRPGFDNGLPPLHSSESQVDQLQVDAQLVNGGTLDELRQQVHRIMAIRAEGASPQKEAV